MSASPITSGWRVHNRISRPARPKERHDESQPVSPGFDFRRTSRPGKEPRQIFVRDQMKEFSKRPLVMKRPEGVWYWDVDDKPYLDALSGIYVVSVGHGNRREIDAIREQFELLHFSPPMHGTNVLAVQLANLFAELAPGDLTPSSSNAAAPKSPKPPSNWLDNITNSRATRATTRSSRGASRGTVRLWGHFPHRRSSRDGASTSRSPVASFTSFHRPAIDARLANPIRRATSPVRRLSAT